MNLKQTSRLILLLAFSCTLTNCVIDNQKSKNNSAKNIILLIGDGMGVAQISAGHIAKNQDLNMERCKYIGFSRTSSASDLITDSGAGGTAIACGIKTNNKFIGLSPDSLPVNSILYYAELHNKYTGLVATCSITHATPASFIAHNLSRYSYEEIAADFLKTDVDVLIGGGLNNFTKREDGKNLMDELRKKGYQTATTMEQLKNIDTPKLAALLYDKHPPYVNDGRGDYLSIATRKAIELLNKNQNGFFLMIEGSQIDWAGHDNNSKNLISEVLDFDKAVGIALDFAEQDGETLVIITADHETGGYVLSNDKENKNKLNGTFSTTHHSAVMVPIMAFGPGAENFMGFMENTEIFNKMSTVFNFNKDK